MYFKIVTSKTFDDLIIHLQQVKNNNYILAPPRKNKENNTSKAAISIKKITLKQKSYDNTINSQDFDDISNDGIEGKVVTDEYKLSQKMLKKINNTAVGNRVQVLVECLKFVFESVIVPKIAKSCSCNDEKQIGFGRPKIKYLTGGHDLLSIEGKYIYIYNMYNFFFFRKPQPNLSAFAGFKRLAP